MWNFIKGLLGNYTGEQRSAPLVPIAPAETESTVSNALQIPAIWECTQKSGPLYHLLSESPNANMTPADFIGLLTTNYLIYGNAYIRIDRARGADYIAALTPLAPHQIKVHNEGGGLVWYEGGGLVWYEYYTEDSRVIRYESADIMHWKGLGNGLIGFSLIDFARSTLDEAAKAQAASADLFRNKGKLNGILSSEAPILSDKQQKEFLESFKAMKQAPLGIPLLPQGFKFQATALSPAETQLLQTREFIVREFARWFGIPEGLLTGEAKDLVETSNYFYETTILPLCIGLEQVMQQKIITEPGLRVKFRTSVLKRMSDQTRIQMQTSYVQNGLRTRNELRRDDGLSRIDGADELTAQNNLFPVSQLGETDPTQTPQTPIPENPVKQ